MKRLAGFGSALLVAGCIGLLAGCASHNAAPHRHRTAAPPPDITRCPLATQMRQATESDYGRNFLARYSTHISYPAEALNAGQTGAVQLCARVNRDGVVLDSRIVQGSGFPLLDGAALLAAGVMKNAKEKAPMPADFAPDFRQVWIAFTVNFKPDKVADETYPRELEDRACKEPGSKDGDQAADTISSSEWGDFPSEFSDAVKKQLIYPAQALAAGESGYTLLCISLDHDSHLLGVSVSRSSGSPLLDGASLLALGMMQVRAEVPNIPDRIRQGHDTITFTQEIDWKPSTAP
jgi:TonB family protein